jgi:AP-3 complex subunit delta-1
MFERSLGDLIRGIRQHTDDENRFVATCMDNCRRELRTGSIDIKANAIAKLTYLQMLGYDISWSCFNMIEVMSSKKFNHKRIGYLAATQTFHPGTDVLMLTPNLLKKDLSNLNMYEASMALDALANFVTPELARDLANDVITLMTSSKPHLRKRATLASYKLFLAYPDALRAAFSRLKDRLEDQEPAVQAAAVNVICELARKNPKNYLPLAPTFFNILTTSQNNWMRIKIIKLFAALTPLEPRLGKKLIEPLTTLIHSTPAMSVMYECVNTIVLGLPDHLPSIQLCVQKLRLFVEDTDQNLKYLGLQALANVLKIHPKAVQAHKDLIIACLDDQDESIRLRALDLFAGMVSKKNL